VDSLQAFINDPNIIYLMLVAGLWIAVTATYIPGTGVMEAAAGILIVVALVVMTTVATNWWAAIILVVGVLSFLLVPFLNERLARWAEGGLILQALGGALLFQDMSVSWLLIGVTVGIALLYHHFALLPLLARNRQMETVIDDNAKLIGAYGRAATTFVPSGSGHIGSVMVGGEQWTAYSEQPLQPGDQIVVVERDGLQLFVEGLKHKSAPIEEEVS
jgi:membrane-bound serine protease (ClpP class)